MTPQLDFLARRIRRHMTARCSTAVETDGYFDVDLHEYVEAGYAALWSGPAHIRPQVRDSQFFETGEQQVGVRRYEVWLPREAIVDGASHVLVTASLGDPTMVTKVFYILDRPFDDWLTARRLIVSYSA